LREAYNLIVIAMNDQRRLVDLLQICGVVDLRELVNAGILADYRAHHALVPERQLESFVCGRTFAIHAKEWDGKFEVEVGPVVEDRLTIGIENRKPRGRRRLAPRRSRP